MLVQARPGHKLMFYFASFDIKYYSYVRGGYRYSGCIDYIDIRDGNSRQSPFIKGNYSICIDYIDITVENSRQPPFIKSNYSGCIDYLDIRGGNSRQSLFIKGNKFNTRCLIFTSKLISLCEYVWIRGQDFLPLFLFARPSR